MPLKIITADERLAETRGPKILIAGPAGVGKTSLLRTVHGPSTLFFDLEAGDLSVQDVAVDQVRARSWQECRDLACFLGGPNLSLDADKAYSQKHYDYVVEQYGDAETLDQYDLYFIDSITVAARLCLQWAQQQPEAFNKDGKPDMRGAYGLLGREMVAWMTQLQHTPQKAVVFVGILEADKDDFGRVWWQLQIDGKKASKEIPGIIDEVLAMANVSFGEGEAPQRALLCNPDAAAHYPSQTYLLKDRSGRLDAYEPPHLGKLLAKLTAKGGSAAQEAA